MKFSFLIITSCVALLAVCPAQSEEEDSKPRCPAPLPCKCIWDTRNSSISEGEENSIQCADQDIRERSLPDLFPSDHPFTKVNYSRNHFYDIAIPDYFVGIVNLSTVDLSHNLLVNVPMVVRRLSNITHLHLEENRIELEETNLFSDMSSLELLDLSSNRVNNVTKGVFSGLKMLKYLILNDNGIVVIVSGALSDLPELKYLYLKQNKFTALQKGYFDGLISLEKLDLEKNKISTIEDGVFSELSSLIELDMTDNSMDKMTTAQYSGLVALKKVIIRYCEIGSIEPGVFDKMLNLSRIDLALNEIDTMSQDIFGKGQESVTYLRLTYNYIHEFAPNFFRPFKSLRYLIIDGNPITRLPDITSVETLIYISIAETRVSTVYACELLTINAGINWGSSPINCDCSARWLKLHHDRIMYFLSPSEIKQRDTWRCNQPENLHGKKFSDIDPSEFVCPAGEDMHYCRPESLHGYKKVEVPLDIKSKGKSAFNLKWNIIIDSHQFEEVDNLTVSASPVKGRGKEVIRQDLTVDTNVTKLDNLEYGTTYNVCIIYWHFGRATKLSYVMGHNCTIKEIPGRNLRPLIITLPLLIIIAVVVTAAAIVYRRLRPSGTARSGSNIGGIENMTYDVSNASVVTSLPGELNLSNDQQTKA